MTSIGFLLLLLLPQVCSEEAEPVFKAEGSVIEMGYCFGVDYIVVYRSAPEGDQLLGNSSAEDAAVTPPADLQGRIRINKNQHLLGLQISDLTHMDSGIYRRECWQNQTLVSQHTEQLSVCDEEGEPAEVTVREEDERAVLLCNSTSAGQEGATVRWYQEVSPTYKLTLLLDSSVSLRPLVEGVQGIMEVRDGGASLLLDGNMLKNNQHFYCLVLKDERCLSFQNMHLPDDSEIRDMFASQGDRVVLNCPADGNDQHWVTPLGRINGSSAKNNQMHISSEEFSLVIPKISAEHGGDYSCISYSLEVHYFLVLCPRKELQEKVASEGETVLLECDVEGEGDSQRVQWHRLVQSGEHELIQDSAEDTIPIPQDLRGRLIVSESGGSLTISHLQAKDQGAYWCVVLEGPQLLEAVDDYDENYDEDNTEGDEDGDDQDWDIPRCIFKQESIVSLRAAVDLEPRDRNIPAEQSAGSNVTAYAVGGGLVGLLVVVGIVALIAVKRRAKASLAQREADARAGCSERLAHSDEHHA